jgi:replicative DNA helicase
MRLAVEERVAVLAASHLNRASEARSDKHPSLADLRESSQLEQDSPVVVLLQRDAEEPFEVVFTVAKNRLGAVGEWAVVADFSRSVFLETPSSDSASAVA